MAGYFSQFVEGQTAGEQMPLACSSQNYFSRKREDEESDDDDDEDDKIPSDDEDSEDEDGDGYSE